MVRSSMGDLKDVIMYGHDSAAVDLRLCSGKELSIVLASRRAIDRDQGLRKLVLSVLKRQVEESLSDEIERLRSGVDESSRARGLGRRWVAWMSILSAWGFS